MKIAGQHTPFWGGQHGRFLHLSIKFEKIDKEYLEIKGL